MRRPRIVLRLGVVLPAVTLLLAMGLPLLLGDYYLHIVNVTLVNILLALGLNFIVGFGGQISLAQSAFFAIGAYVFALLQMAGLPTLPAALVGVAAAASVGFALGAPTLRLQGHYLALATLGFGLIVEELLTNLSDLTGGGDGLISIPGIGLAGQTRPMLYVLLPLVAVGYGVSEAFVHSPLGMRVRAFRDDAMAAQAAGVGIRALKVMLFVVSATYAGVAGVAYVCLMGYLAPNVFSWQSTFAYLSMIIVGGLGSSLGAVVGAILYIFVPELLRFLQEAYFAIFGLAVIVIVVLSPDGLVGLGRRLWHRLTRRVARRSVALS
jgi:branched-chain amino acid transport system permease protein